MAQQRKFPYRYKESSDKVNLVIGLTLGNGKVLRVLRNGYGEAFIINSRINVSDYSPEEIDFIEEFWAEAIKFMRKETERIYGNELPDKFRYRQLPDGIEINE